MAKIVEISIFKILIIITGILSLILAWTTISFQGDAGLYTIRSSADYNFIGYIIRMNLGFLNLDNPGEYKISILTLFGILYLIGFLFTLINVRIDKKDNLKVLGGIGVIFVIIGFLGYTFAFLELFFNSKLLIEEDLSSLYLNHSYEFFFNAGFYLAIATIIFIALELFYKNQHYIQFNLVKSQRVPEIRQVVIKNDKKKVIEANYCEECGAKILFKTGKFCYKCGASLE